MKRWSAIDSRFFYAMILNELQRKCKKNAEKFACIKEELYLCSVKKKKVMKKSDYVGMLFLAAGVVVLCAETETVQGLIIKGLVSVGCIAVAAIIAIFQNINYKS